MKTSAIFLVAGSVFLGACVAWELVGGKHVATGENYEVHLPAGWRRHNFTRDAIRITRDGTGLQQIVIGRWPIDKGLPSTKRKLSERMLPQELAELAADDFRSNPSYWGFEVLEDLPSTIGGHPGFRIVYRYRMKDGLRKKGAYCGALVGDWYYYLFFEAPEQHYFAKDLRTFETVRESFRLLAP